MGFRHVRIFAWAKRKKKKGRNSYLGMVGLIIDKDKNYMKPCLTDKSYVIIHIKIDQNVTENDLSLCMLKVLQRLVTQAKS